MASISTIIAPLRTTLKAFQTQQWNWPPEMREYACDLHDEVTRDFINQHEVVFKTFIRSAKQNDINQLLTDAFTAEIWTAMRRSFFSVLFLHAIQLEAEGDTVSKDFITFYRQRYNPRHVFELERCQRRCAIIKEDLMKEMWKPSRIQAILDMGGQTLLDSYV